MLKRLGFRSVLVPLLAVALAAPGGAAAASTTDGSGSHGAPVSKAGTRAVVLSSSAKEVEEGDRYTLIAAIKSPRSAARVTFQKWVVPLYVGTPSWETVKTVNVRGKAKVAFKAVATDINTERYRAVVIYKDAKPVASKPVNVTVWRWIPLKEYAPYYEAEPYAAVFGTTTINGVAYSGWGAASYSHTGAWESRFTPGRHCKSFKAVLGLGDISDDGSSGTITFTADDEQVYASPTLTPGMSVPVTVPLAAPYRFGIQLFDTAPGGTAGHDAVEAWPVLGEPAFLCTGV